MGKARTPGGVEYQWDDPNEYGQWQSPAPTVSYEDAQLLVSAIIDQQRRIGQLEDELADSERQARGLIAQGQHQQRWIDAAEKKIDELASPRQEAR